jgi:hypothetical protein
MSTAACHELIERMNESDGHTPGLYGTVLYNTQPEEWLHNNGGHGRGHFSMVWYHTEYRGFLSLPAQRKLKMIST